MFHGGREGGWKGGISMHFFVLLSVCGSVSYWSGLCCIRLSGGGDGSGDPIAVRLRPIVVCSSCCAVVRGSWRLKSVHVSMPSTVLRETGRRLKEFGLGVGAEGSEVCSFFVRKRGV